MPMMPTLHRFGASQSPVVVIDDASGAAQDIIRLAVAMGPFPPAADTNYPGLRRVFGAADAAAMAYADHMLQALAPFIGGAFDMEQFTLVEPSFSIVTTPPAALSPVQRAPHFDTVEPNVVAVVHYLTDMPSTGTAFYRHRSTGIEVVGATNVDEYVAVARHEAERAPSGYIQGSNDRYENIGLVEARLDRVVMYRGGLLHSGIIPPSANLSADPARGRLTANFFIAGA